MGHRIWTDNLTRRVILEFQGDVILFSEFLHRRKDATLYVHFPCFDGVISGVLTILFLRKSRHWKFRTIRPIDYRAQDQWISFSLPRHTAVVDFLYHPQAEFWADHHATAFLSEQLRHDFEGRKGESRLYDRQIGSCARLLWRTIGASLDYDPRLGEMVHWADKIDSAAYESVQEAFSADPPAIRLSRSLAIDATGEYCRFLIFNLEEHTLEETAKSHEVQKRFAEAQELGALGMERVEKDICLQNGVAWFDVDGKGVLINRYAPYKIFPRARYSIAVVRFEESAKITIMRNPWLDFESVNLGEFLRKWKGGGHQRVGSVILEKERLSEVNEIVSQSLHKLMLNTAQSVQV